MPELVEYFLTMFSPAEALEFVDASDKQEAYSQAMDTDAGSDGDLQKPIEIGFETGFVKNLSNRFKQFLG